MQQSRRFEVLDSFRGLCALSVVLYHLHVSGSFADITCSLGCSKRDTKPVDLGHFLVLRCGLLVRTGSRLFVEIIETPYLFVFWKSIFLRIHDSCGRYLFIDLGFYGYAKFYRTTNHPKHKWHSLF